MDLPPEIRNKIYDLLLIEPIMEGRRIAHQLPKHYIESNILFGDLLEEGDDAEQDHKMFLALAKPRVRYDVEVVTKLVIYAGMKRFCDRQRARLTHSQALLGLRWKATPCSSKSPDSASTACFEQKVHLMRRVQNDMDPVHNV